MDRKAGQNRIAIVGLQLAFFTLVLWGGRLPAQSPCDHPLIQEVIDSRDTTLLRKKAEDLSICPEWQDSVGLLYHKLGVLYYQNNDWDEAIRFSERAVEVRLRLYAEEPFAELGQTYYNLSAFYQKKIAYFTALEYMERALAVYQEVGDTVWEYNALLSMADVNRYLGDYDKAETILRVLLNNIPADKSYSRAEAQLNLSNVLLAQERYVEVVSLAEAAEQVFNQYPGNLNLPSSLHNRILALEKLGRYQEAIRSAERALRLYREAGDSYSEASLLNVLGLAQLYHGDSQDAQRTLTKALGISKEEGFYDMEAITYDNLGELELSGGNFLVASGYFESSIATTAPYLAESNQLTQDIRDQLRQISDKENLFVAIYDYTRAAQQLNGAGGDYERTIFLAEVGDYLLEELRYNHTSERSKLFWREKALPFYEQVIAITAQQDDAQRAFYFMEQSKAVLLLDAMLESQAQEYLPDSLRQALQNLNVQLQGLRENLSYQEEEAKAATLRQILDKEAAQAALYEKILANYGQYRSILAQRAVITPAQFRAQYLPSEGCLLHYFFGEDAVYALLLSADDLTISRLGQRDSIRELTQNLLHYFTDGEQLAATPAAYLHTARQLYAKLLSPLQANLTKNLWIIPDGPLAYLPFEALCVNEAEALGQARYLLQDYGVNYAFSASLFQQMTARAAQNQGGTLLALAPFVSKGSEALAPLPFSAKELDHMANYYKIARLEGEDASLTALLAQQDKAAVLHLSTHAFASYDETEQPRVYLADTVLRLRDLYLMKVPAELVVLSACQSNIGQLAKGEGVLGLGRGFCYAGASSFVAGLWQLNDQYTSQLMHYFYANLASGKAKGEALRQAKLDFLQDPDIPSFQKSPYYWAGLTYYGDDRGLSLQPKGAGYGWWAAGGLLLLLLVGMTSWWRVKTER